MSFTETTGSAPLKGVLNNTAPLTEDHDNKSLILLKITAAKMKASQIILAFNITQYNN